MVGYYSLNSLVAGGETGGVLWKKTRRNNFPNYFARGLGFEPRLHGSEPWVLPLYYPRKLNLQILPH